MALMDRFREAWEDLRGTRKEEQEAGQSLTESTAQPAKEYRTVAAPGESGESPAFDRSVGPIVATVALDTEPGKQKRTDIGLDQGTQESTPAFDRFHSSQDTHLRTQDYSRNSPDWQDFFQEPRHTPAEIAHLDEQYMRVSSAIGAKHSSEFSYEKENGDLYTYKHSPTGNRIHLDSRGEFYDVQEGKEPTLTTRAEVLRSYQEPSPEVLTTLTSEHREQWSRLEKEVGFKGADNFNLVEQRGDVNVYVNNTDDRKNLISLDSKGQFYDPSHEVPIPISREQALQTVHVEQHFYTPENRHLREAVGNEHAPDLLPYNKSGDIRSYMNESTGSAIHHDSEGRFYNLERQVISREEAVFTMQSPVGNQLGNIASAAATPSFDHGAPRHEGVPHLPSSDLAVESVKIPAPTQEQSLSL